MKTVTRIYEGIALLLTLGCLSILIFERAPRYDVQLGELNTVIQQSWQRGQQKVSEDMANLKVEVRQNGNSREGRERIKLAKLLLKKTTAITNKLEQWHTQSFAPVQAALQQYKQWLKTEFKYIDLAPIDTAQTLDASFDLGKASTIASKALIGEKKLHIQRLQAMILRQLGAGDYIDYCHLCGYFKVNVVPQLQQVQVGNYYQAEVPIQSITISYTKPRFSVGNTPIPVNAGKSDIVFKPQGTGTQYWEAKFRFLSRGKDTAIVHKVYYKVLPPTN